MSKTWVYSGGRPSNGAKLLAEQEGFLRLRQERLFKVKAGDTIINWGCSELPAFQGVKVLNRDFAVHASANKSASFAAFQVHDVKCVEWTETKDHAAGWLADGKTVVVRNKLTGHSGEGIVIIEPGQELPDAPLYTKYVFKDKEYRVHVCNGKVVDTQRKIRDPDREVVTWKVRSHDNGFMFVRGNILPDDARDALAIKAVASLGLDFGAVDLITCDKGGIWVLEVNTAPGLEGQTVTNYAEVFRGSAEG